MDKKYKMKLYITGTNERVDDILDSLKDALQAITDTNYDLEVINVLSDPERASDDNVIATPTIVLYPPDPERRAVGSLEDIDKVIMILGLYKPG